MADENPFAKLLDQIAEILKVVKAGTQKEPIAIPPATLQRLAVLAQQVQMLETIADDMYLSEGQNPHKALRLAKAAGLEKKDLKFFEKLNTLGKEVAELKKVFDLFATRGATLPRGIKPIQGGRQFTPEEKKKQIKQRKRKFRGVGGTDGWKPV